MTQTEGQPAKAVDPLASQRVALLGRVAAAQLELERTIASLRARAASVPGELDTQLSDLAALRQQVASARPSELSALNHAVAASLASAKLAASQIGSTEADGASISLTAAASAAHCATDSAMAYTRDLSLRFASAEDERAYCEREAERAAYIVAQQAKHTPQGDLNASGAAVGQLADAHAHGASGPEFDRHWKELTESTAKLRDAIRRDGGSTKEFDDHLREDLRAIMKAKGLSDAQIAARFAANADPLEAAKAFVAEADLEGLKTGIKDAKPPAPTVAAATEAAVQPGPNMAAALAELVATGITASDASSQDTPTHGLTVAARPATRSGHSV